MTRPTDPRIPALLDAYRETGVVFAAAKRVGMCPTTAGRHIRAAGISRKEMDWQAEAPRIVEMMRSGMTIRQIARSYNKSYSTLYRAVHWYILCDAAEDITPESHQVFGPIGTDIDAMSAKISRYVHTLGAATLIRRRDGVVAAAIPGSRVARRAEYEGCVVATYATEARDDRHRPTGDAIRRAIREDLEHEMRGCV